MILSRNELEQLCNNHLVELLFNRRGVPNPKPTRRMLCTRDQRLLKSELGKLTFNYNPPTSRLPYDHVQKGLVVVFDILKQDWRMIPANGVSFVNAVPTWPQENFWEYFDKKLRNMTKRQKINFINQ
jgi:hypothetical protein